MGRKEREMTVDTVYANENGTLIRHGDFPARAVPPRNVDVWCPPGYAEGSGRHPVVYMADGQNLFLPGYAFGGEAWSVDQALVRLVDEGRVGGALVVGVWNGGEARAREYMPQKPMALPGVRAAAAAYAETLAGEAVADAYLAFVVHDLKPFIDATYRTLPDQAHTLAMGSSMGGLISLYALTEYPQVFGGAGCLSTHWPAGGEGLVDYFGEAVPRPGNHRLYFDFGTGSLDHTYEPFQARMDGHLRRAGYKAGRDWLTRQFPGADHTESAWRERVEIPLAFLLRAAE
jgi:predicted alpha/beta superfamily hydrolase